VAEGATATLANGRGREARSCGGRAREEGVREYAQFTSQEYEVGLRFGTTVPTGFGTNQK
jgi:hypothetical protein